MRAVRIAPDGRPDATIIAVEQTVKCNDAQSVRSGFHALLQQLEATRSGSQAAAALSAVIGPGCSDDVEVLSDPQLNTYLNSSGDERALLFAPNSTDVWLQDSTLYPNVLRVTTSELYFVHAASERRGSDSNPSCHSGRMPAK
eukprot:4764704-Prymnesium_polylepis.1